jgi:hypothetical protein
MSCYSHEWEKLKKNCFGFAKLTSTTRSSCMRTSILPCEMRACNEIHTIYQKTYSFHVIITCEKWSDNPFLCSWYGQSSSEAVCQGRRSDNHNIQHSSLATHDIKGQGSTYRHHKLITVSHCVVMCLATPTQQAYLSSTYVVKLHLDICKWWCCSYHDWVGRLPQARTQVIPEDKKSLLCSLKWLHSMVPWERRTDLQVELLQIPTLCQPFPTSHLEEPCQFFFPTSDHHIQSPDKT